VAVLLYFAGDGARDSASVPPLVERVLGTAFTVHATTWKEIRLRQGTFEQKVQFALRQAFDMGAAGAVITGDRDRGGKRELLKLFIKQRTKENHRSGLRAALGVADPHGEAWLLDDPAAVREALHLEEGTEVPRVQDGYPKELLQGLIDGSARAGDEVLVVLSDIAREVQLDRCRSATNTGFRAFVQDIQNELGQLAV
jgi:hypothetical protein